MIDKLFELLNTNPLLSIIFGFVLAGLAMILFRNEIKLLIKKKYNLYSEEELKSFGIYVKEHTEIKENNENVGFVKFAKDSTANNKINEYMTNWKIISE